ncbi:DUF3313 family protein [Brevundimonas sp. FT23042]|uniref:DUF3313 family protein n=1 Tax=Brevundimonas sp. FT23042 TaxID=3393749 RepID=UPI003B588B3F
MKSSPRSQTPPSRCLALAAVGAAASLGACQSAAPPHSGFLSSYSRLATEPAAASPNSHRDDALSDTITRVYILPAVLRLADETRIGSEDLAAVRFEVDRQICYEISERFQLATSPEPGIGVIRSAVVDVRPTNAAGSAVSAAAGFFIPVPILSVRVPMTTGGLSAEAELLTPDGSQAAALVWSRSADVVGRTEPSFSAVGDALQLAEPFGDAVGDAFSSAARRPLPIPEPDPCAHYGPRSGAGQIAGRAVGALTGLYVPSISGAGRPATAPAEALPVGQEAPDE